MTKAVIQSTTSAVTTSDSESIIFDVDRATGIFSSGLAGSETVGLHYYESATDTWETLVDDSGSAVELTATKKNGIINAPGRYRCSKSATASAAGVSVGSTPKD